MAHHDGVGAELFHHWVVQHAVQVGALDREVQLAVAGVAAPGLAEDEMAVPVEVGELARLDAEPAERVEQAEPRQGADRVRLHVDADAARHEILGQLADAAGDAFAMQGEVDGQFADAAAENDDLYVAVRVASVTRRRAPEGAPSGTRGRDLPAYSRSQWQAISTFRSARSSSM